ncbi:ABC-type transport system ATP-binding protein (probable substrate dipeptide/oligopeptide) [Natrialba magadii ATCC 43099]|uniref:ABC-type transport system ATP-binding protein (Probable substrate dipeptide/oligopeptide) n=1 Tax=Natrialba magadii (strain ATCC 43099 / DSM 3394 / CCM 3739 / CIP 104546 / IAM 13178 / JCM 8861 / NBRC 102185 / NCIMB 2190 / MS3) TaxID=547559 RepID=D3SWI0_NATMM|nr:ABC transporter ATP-binding protein [Natrialba magadii]ADD03772.1 ABC-type transport system ATP-binding protein (probable substrate dipeptide/oligopeptide) [Natrialba magadii ATCC 43099]ELY33827.1 peptide ABC transporter ATPase [Natrialba magadii ATCC 43099]
MSSDEQATNTASTETGTDLSGTEAGVADDSETHATAAATTSAGEPLVSVQNLEKYFWENDSLLDRLVGEDPVAVRAVDGVSFDIYEGETLGLVGESGCGKSTTGETLLRLQESTGGRVEFEGENVYEMDSGALTDFRQNAQVVFQDPFSSLDPRMTIGDIVQQPLDIHDVGTTDERRARVRDLLERVGLSTDQLDRYPHEFSGGQRQRIGIARALALEPEFLVLDEPTSALDVSVQAQVLNLLEDLQNEFDLTYLLISHDLSVIRHICDRVAVMYLGEIVEIGPVEELFDNPKHPYTKALLESVPRATTDERERDRETLAGDVPSPRNPPSGCRFRTRCPMVIPPEGMQIEQETFREIMTARERIENRDISLETVGGDQIELEDGSVPSEDVPAFVDLLHERLFDEPLPQRHRERVDEAFAELADTNWEAAESTLRTEYETVCERVNPGLGEGGHPVACHLYGEAGDSANAADPDSWS